jgi:hypothetical protein
MLQLFTKNTNLGYFHAKVGINIGVTTLTLGS